MPIRTNRGRAAVYRRLWGWPLRSPRHLMVTMVGLLVFGILIATVLARGAAGKHNSTAGPANQAPGVSAPGSPGGNSGATGTPPATRLASPTGTPTSAPPAPEALDVISAWGRAWVNHPVGMTNQQWLDQLTPYTTPEFLTSTMTTVNVANIVATQVTGSPTAVKSYTSSVEATLPTNAGTLDITAIDTPQGWQVNSYNPGS